MNVFTVVVSVIADYVVALGVSTLKPIMGLVEKEKLQSRRSWRVDQMPLSPVSRSEKEKVVDARRADASKSTANV